jgi:hypothetical protein
MNQVVVVIDGEARFWFVAPETATNGPTGLTVDANHW